MICRRVIHLIVICALFLGVTMLPVFVATSSHQAEASLKEETHHGTLNAVMPQDDRHVHDDGDDYERQIGHIHGHDPADHSHQAVFLGSTLSQDRPKEKDKPFAAVSGVIRLKTRFGIDRPPKLFARA
jgi:hypothetical protein